MTLITTGDFAQNLRPGINTWAGLTYESFPTLYDKMFDVEEGEARAYQEDVMSSTLGLALVKPQGSPISYDKGEQAWSVRYTHVMYALGFIITLEAIEDGTGIKLAEVHTKALTESMLKTRETICANVLNNAFTAGNTMADFGTGLGGDGVILASSAHPTRSGNQSNVPVTPADLSEAALEQAIIDITNFVNDRGLRIMAVPKKIIVPNALQFTIDRILKSPLRSGTADNDINALREKGVFSDGIVMNPYLSSSTAYFIKTDIKGLKFINRKDIMVSDDNDFDTTNAKFKGIMRFAQGWTDWRSIYCVNGP